MTQPPGPPSAAAIKTGHRPAAAAAPPRGRSPIGRPKPRWGTWLAIVLLIVLPVAALWRVCGHSFVAWDDLKTVAQNPSLDPVTLHSLRVWWTTTKMDLYVPVTYTAWGIIALFARVPATADAPAYLSPVPFHTANLVLHVLSVLVVFQILRLLMKNTWPAAAGALVFAVHPVQAEAVAWMSGLKDVLGGLLALSGIWQYLLAVRKPLRAGVYDSGLQSGARQRWNWHYALALLLFALAMLAKPSDVVAPVIAGAIDVLLLGRSWRQALRWLWPIMVVMAACVVEAKLVQPTVGTTRNVAVYLRPVVSIASIGFYIRKLLWPMNLTVDYGFRPIVALHSPWLVADFVVVFGLAAVLWIKRRAARPMAVGAIVFLVAVLPVLGLVTYDFQWYSNVADHYLYLPMLGIAIMSAWAAGRWHGLPFATGCGLVIALLAARSFFQTDYWADTQTLFNHTTDVNPDGGPAYNQLAQVALDQGNFPFAAELAQACIARRPESALGYISYGVALWHMHRDHDAAEQYLMALQAKDGSDDTTEMAMEDLVIVLKDQKQFPQAELFQRQVLAKNPASAEAHFELGTILEDEKKLPEAIGEFQTAIRLDPSVGNYHLYLAQTLGSAGHLQAALEQYTIALRIDPTDPAALAGQRRLLGAHRK